MHWLRRGARRRSRTKAPTTRGDTHSNAFHGHRSFYFRNFERYREVMVEQGDQDKQLWFTEFGWASGQAGHEWAYAAETSE